MMSSDYCESDGEGREGSGGEGEGTSEWGDARQGHARRLRAPLKHVSSTSAASTSTRNDKGTWGAQMRVPVGALASPGWGRASDAVSTGNHARSSRIKNLDRDATSRTKARSGIKTRRCQQGRSGPVRLRSETASTFMSRSSAAALLMSPGAHPRSLSREPGQAASRKPTSGRLNETKQLPSRHVLPWALRKECGQSEDDNSLGRLKLAEASVHAARGRSIHEAPQPLNRPSMSEADEAWVSDVDWNKKKGASWKNRNGPLQDEILLGGSGSHLGRRSHRSSRSLEGGLRRMAPKKAADCRTGTSTGAGSCRKLTSQTGECSAGREGTTGEMERDEERDEEEREEELEGERGQEREGQKVVGGGGRMGGFLSAVGIFRRGRDKGAGPGAGWQPVRRFATQPPKGGFAGRKTGQSLFCTQPRSDSLLKDTTARLSGVRRLPSGPNNDNNVTAWRPQPPMRRTESFDHASVATVKKERRNVQGCSSASSASSHNWEQRLGAQLLDRATVKEDRSPHTRLVGDGSEPILECYTDEPEEIEEEEEEDTETEGMKGCPADSGAGRLLSRVCLEAGTVEGSEKEWEVATGEGRRVVDGFEEKIGQHLILRNRSKSMEGTIHGSTSDSSSDGLSNRTTPHPRGNSAEPEEEEAKEEDEEGINWSCRVVSEATIAKLAGKVVRSFSGMSVDQKLREAELLLQKQEAQHKEAMRVVGMFVLKLREENLMLRSSAKEAQAKAAKYKKKAGLLLGELDMLEGKHQGLRMQKKAMLGSDGVGHQQEPESVSLGMEFVTEDMVKQVVSAAREEVEEWKQSVMAALEAERESLKAEKEVLERDKAALKDARKVLLVELQKNLSDG